ncbi:retrotransposon nucleocapsid protein [Lentinula edodes]|uniref:Retrotransposon nucleocapsid protein n=1 Tax=Lentinula edodes TaxID=5353 RepID=A0A1Q3ER47_LENED|nr:retrotransposon nucleocapsid protein [Lentinula edodes]
MKLEEVKDEEYEASQPGPHELFPSDKNLGPDDPILMGINEWLAFASKSMEQEMEETLEAGQSVMETGTPQPAKNSEEACQKWKSRDTERSSSWPGAKQKVRWKKDMDLIPTSPPKSEHTQDSVKILSDSQGFNKIPEQGGVVKELNEEASKRHGMEELKKSIPVQYQDYLDVFLHRPYDIKIKTEGDAIPPIGRFYNMSEKELKFLKEYIDGSG